MRPHRNPRQIRQIIWSSALYRRGRRLAAVLTRPFRRFELALIFRKDLTGQLERFESDPDIEIGPASAEEIEQAATAIGRRQRGLREVFRWRVESGCMCFVARAGSTLTGYDWIRFRPGLDDGDMIALAEGELYSFDLYVDENWRGRRVAVALGTQAHLFLKGQGYKTSYARVSVLNRKSVKNNRRCGWTPSGLVLRVRSSKRGGWPIITLWGSSYPLSRPRLTDTIAPSPRLSASAGDATDEVD
jgi:GNAT superfamily N-acetyltransferase